VRQNRWSIWKGSQGLRSGWAVLLYVAIGSAVAAALFGIVYWQAHFTTADIRGTRSRLTPGFTLAAALTQSCGFLIATAVMSRVDRRSWQEYGLRARRGVVLFAQGAFWGALLMSALVGTLALTHAMTIKASGGDLPTVIRWGLLWAAVFIPAALVEELTYRGYSFFRLARAINPTRAAIITSLWFGLVHLANSGETVLGIAQVVGVGLVFCLATWRTGSLWWALGAHAAWNWTQTFVFGCANSGHTATGQWLLSTPTGPAWLSGGSTGPEGSILSLVAQALQAGIILLTLPGPRAAAPTQAVAQS